MVSLLLFGGAAAAQPGQIGGPLAGYVYDRAASAVRPVRGLPGAATLGDPLALGIAPQAGFVAPSQDLAVLVAADGTTHWYGLSGNAATEVTANGSIETPERVVFSPSGKAAALITGHRVEVVTGLPAKPALAGNLTTPIGSCEIALAAGANRGAARGKACAAASLALSDDGAWLLLAAGSELRLIGVSSASSVTLMTIGPAVLAFAPGNHDAAVSTAGSLIVIRDATGSATQQPLTADSALGRAVGVAFSPDGGTLYAAGSAGLVYSYDLAGGTGVEQSSGAAATVLEPMGGYFRLNEAGSGPLWLVVPVAGSPRVFFVPPAATSN